MDGLVAAIWLLASNIFSHHLVVKGEILTVRWMGYMAVNNYGLAHGKHQPESRSKTHLPCIAMPLPKGPFATFEPIAELAHYNQPNIRKKVHKTEHYNL